jgi:hypothetical protein
VILTDEVCFLKVLGSRNGVLVNKNRVPSRREQKLKNGDVLLLGRTSIVFKDVAPGEQGPPIPEPRIEDREVGPAPAAVEVVAVDLMDRTVAEKVQRPVEEKTVDPRPAEKPRFKELVADDASLVGMVPAKPVAKVAAPAPAGDQVALRDLLRRAERERVFYRNLVIGMVGFLMLVLVALLFYALGRARGQEEWRAPTRRRPPRLRPTTIVLVPSPCRRARAATSTRRRSPTRSAPCWSARARRPGATSRRAARAT